MQPHPERGILIEVVRFGDGEHARESEGEHETQARQPEYESEHAADPACAEAAERGRRFQFAAQTHAFFVEPAHARPAY